MQNLYNIASTTIPQAKNNYMLVKRNYVTSDIIDLVKESHPFAVEQTKDFATKIPGTTIDEYLHNLWNFLKENIQYQVDEPGSQLVKLPSKLLSDKHGDCKSFSLFVGSVLENKGIPFKYRFVRYRPYGPVTHVYVIVPQKGGKYYTVDVVYHAYNKEKKFVQPSKDIDMKGLYQVSGIGANNTDFNFPGDPRNMTEGQMDLYIARENAAIKKGIVQGMGGIGSNLAEQYQDRIDAIDDALETMQALQRGKINTIEAIGEMNDIADMAETGEYSLAKNITGIFGIGAIAGKAKRKAKKTARKERKKTIRSIKKTEGKKAAKAYRKKNPTKTRKFLTKVAKATAKVVTAPARLPAAMLLKTALPKSAPMFLPLFLQPVSLLPKMSKSFQEKHKKASTVKDIYVKGLQMKEKHFMGIVRNGIMKHYKKSPENVLAEMMKGKNIAGIGAIGASAIAAAKKILEVLAKVFKKAFKFGKGNLSLSEKDLLSPSDFSSMSSSDKNDIITDIKNSPEGDNFEAGGKSIWSSLG